MINPGDFVRITPIVSRYNGMDVSEIGLGGGLGDLEQHHELDLTAPDTIYQLMGYCVSRLQAQPELGPLLDMLQKMLDANTPAMMLSTKLLDNVTKKVDQNGQRATPEDNLPLESLLPALVELSRTGNEDQAAMHKTSKKNGAEERSRSDGLPSRITFPYARHSSYEELCLLIAAFQPKDITPCTVIEVDWHAGRSMGSLFGHLYNQDMVFRHDTKMQAQAGSNRKTRRRSPSPEISSSDHVQESVTDPKRSRNYPPSSRLESSHDGFPLVSTIKKLRPSDRAMSSPEVVRIDPGAATSPTIGPPRQTRDMMMLQRDAYEAALGLGGRQWSDIELISTRKGPYLAEDEL